MAFSTNGIFRMDGVAKGTLREKEMPYIGHLLTAKGVKPDQEKIAAITNTLLKVFWGR
jgi:hypothetical protein